jgi:hypothetical protein
MTAAEALTIPALAAWGAVSVVTGAVATARLQLDIPATTLSAAQFISRMGKPPGS